MGSPWIETYKLYPPTLLRGCFYIFVNCNAFLYNCSCLYHSMHRSVFCVITYVDSRTRHDAWMGLVLGNKLMDRESHLLHRECLVQFE